MSLLTAVVGWCADARAAPDLSASGELQLGVGHDTNVFLSSTPDATASFPRLGGWLAEAAPGLELALAGGGARLELTYDADYRRAENIGGLLYQQGALTAYSPELGPLRLQLGGVVGRFDPASFPEDGFWFMGMQAGTRVALDAALRLLLGYRIERRSALEATVVEADTVHYLETRLSFRPTPRLALEPRASFLTIVPGGSGSTFWRLRGGLEANLVWQQWTLSGGLSAGPLSAPAESATYAGAQAEARREVLTDLDLFASLEWAAPVAGEPQGEGLYRRFAVVTGVVLHGTTRPEAAPRAAAEEDLRPFVEQSRVRFRVRAPSATSVKVLGSWDDWTEPGHALAPTRDHGLWELWLALPPGAHRYHFVVDGVLTRPPNAARYMPDGFGGEDGVVEVTEGSVVSSDAAGSYVR
jgi:hypothetical protein